MSQRCLAAEYEHHYEALSAVYDMADSWRRGDAMRWFQSAIQRLQYFKLERSEVTMNLRPAVRVRGKFSLAKRLPELVQVDLSNIWAEASVKAHTSYHTYRTKDFGFEGEFLAVYGSDLVTVLLEVVGAA